MNRNSLSHCDKIRFIGLLSVHSCIKKWNGESSCNDCLYCFFVGAFFYLPFIFIYCFLWCDRSLGTSDSIKLETSNIVWSNPPFPKYETERGNKDITTLFFMNVNMINPPLHLWKSMAVLYSYSLQQMQRLIDHIDINVQPVNLSQVWNNDTCNFSSFVFLQKPFLNRESIKIS